MKRLALAPIAWQRIVQPIWMVMMPLLMATQLFVAPAHATGVYEMPAFAPDRWILDKAEIISRSNEGMISNTLKQLAADTGYEVRYVTIHRLDYEETAQSFAEQLFQTWFPTPEAQANQVLLVMDNVTNNTGIKTGSAVQSVLSEPIAQSVAQETVLVPLKQGNKYNQAFLDATARLSAVLSGEADPGPPAVNETIQVEGTFATPEETKASNATFWVIGFLIVATIVPMATYYWYVR